MARFGVKEVADVILYDLANGGKPAMFLDSLKMSNLENDAETSYVQGGKGNPRLMSFDYNRTATFTLQDALMNPKAIAMQAGAEVVKGAVNAHKREVLEAVVGATAGTTTVTLANAPVAGSSTTYKTTDGYDHNAEVEESTEAQTMVYSDVDVPAGTKVIVYYQYETTADAERVIISSDKYAGFYKVVGQTVIRNASTNKDEAFEIEVPKAKIMSNFAINLSPDGEPAVFDMALDVFKPEGNSEMVKLTRIG
jgi:hypothetical protein